ncbi:endonuclease YncB(thermonuclease family) [Aminobacter lissarensis]|uniref:Endonuclease YncB(Thermonuclease family) n=1 Tax=Aminobacter carboxidus TaxID=376165 RepID=A0A8E2BA00_9HYPH|nr:thermonuclease family protein [Aminobacter lissarensis]MBB6465006.1 endonuclease YncB(thermonuclease family) [Aminobacter lissarensis]
MSRSWSGRPRQRYFRRPRSRWRKFLDYALASAVLGLLILVSARLDRVETRKSEGVAVVNDGDSITLGSERVRLRGIDAPEYSQICRKDGADYPCGRRSREALSKLVAGRQVSCAGWERDRYRRLLGECTVAGIDLNSSQVEAGWAVAYGGYEAEEVAARRGRKGLWAGDFDRPRDWRNMHGDMAEIEHGSYGRILNWLREIFRFS